MTRYEMTGSIDTNRKDYQIFTQKIDEFDASYLD